MVAAPEMVRLDSPAELAMPISEAMFAQCAIRRLAPARPVADGQLRIVLDVGSKAPNGANTQPVRNRREGGPETC